MYMDTFEYKKKKERKPFNIINSVIIECTYDYLIKEFSTISNGKFYHTTDTNQFFYDWNNNRYELLLFNDKIESLKQIINDKIDNVKNDLKKCNGLTDEQIILINKLESNLLDVNNIINDIVSESLNEYVKKVDIPKKIGDMEDADNYITKEYFETHLPEQNEIIEVNDTNKLLRDYITSDNTIKFNEFYTSQGMNTYNENEVGEDYIILSNGGDSYIQLNNGKDEAWIVINIVDDTLGFNLDDIKIKDINGDIFDYVNCTPIKCGVQICFGKDIDFTGMKEKRPNGDEYIFGLTGSTYEDIDIYREDKVVDVVINNDIKLLTDIDKSEIEDKLSTLNSKIDEISNTLMIDTNGDGEKDGDIKEVIINMNNAINKLDNINVPYKVENGKTIVEVDGEKKELCTKEYVDKLFALLQK